MKDMELERVLPADIEKRSMELIDEELARLGALPLPTDRAAVMKRVIHTTADFEYLSNLYFSPEAVQQGVAALRRGAVIVTDTQMAKAGVNKLALAQLGGRAECYMSDPDIAETARREGTTRAWASMDKAALLPEELIVAVGNAPTALVRLAQLIQEGGLRPALIVGVPVGFVNVVESKELICSCGLPCIVARGRKGGSNVAAAICNALLYEATGRVL